MAIFSDSKMMESHTVLQLVVSLSWFALCLIAIWKWERPFYRVFPFLMATVEPVILGWDELVLGAIVMNVLTAGMLWSLSWGGLRKHRKGVGLKSA